MVECGCSSCGLLTVLCKPPSLALQGEMSWYHSLVQCEEQFIVTQLSELAGCKLNMAVLFVDTSGLSIDLC